MFKFDHVVDTESLQVWDSMVLTDGEDDPRTVAILVRPGQLHQWFVNDDSGVELMSGMAESREDAERRLAEAVSGTVG